MAENNNYTIWQRLTKVFGPDSTLDQQAPVYNFDRQQILKTTDKKETKKSNSLHCLVINSCFTDMTSKVLIN